MAFLIAQLVRNSRQCKETGSRKMPWKRARPPCSCSLACAGTAAQRMEATGSWGETGDFRSHFRSYLSSLKTDGKLCFESSESSEPKSSWDALRSLSLTGRSSTEKTAGTRSRRQVPGPSRRARRLPWSRASAAHPASPTHLTRGTALLCSPPLSRGPTHHRSLQMLSATPGWQLTPGLSLRREGETHTKFTRRHALRLYNPAHILDAGQGPQTTPSKCPGAQHTERTGPGHVLAPRAHLLESRGLEQETEPSLTVSACALDPRRPPASTATLLTST